MRVLATCLSAVLLLQAVTSNAPAAKRKPAGAKAEKKEPEQVLVIYAFDSPDNRKMAARMTDSMRMRAARLKGLVVIDGLSTDDLLEKDDRPTLEMPLAKVAALTEKVFGADLALWGRISGSGDNFTLKVKALDLTKSKTRLAFEFSKQTQAKRQLNWFSDEILKDLTGKRKPGIVEADPEKAAATPTKGPNLVVNGDFEKGGTSPLAWDRVNGMTTFYDKGRTGRGLKIDTDVYESEFNAWMRRFRAGAPASRAPKKTPTSGNKYNTVAGNYGQSYYSADILVLPGKRYKVSIDFRGTGGKIWVRWYGYVAGERRRVFDGQLNLRSATGGKKWERGVRVLRIPKTGETSGAVEVVRIVIYAYWPPGTFYFDNVGFWEVDEKKAAGGTAKSGNDTKPTAGDNGQKVQKREKTRIFLKAAGNKKDVVILFGKDKEPVGDFKKLRERLRALRKGGAPNNHPVVIMPTSEVEDKWVAKAFDTIIAAGFSNIHFKLQP